MRLTLRTLLAYLDDILDPADAQQLGSKIAESEFATALVHQIRGSVRRLRLDAPALDAQGVGSELNSVAEYLDNVLPPDQVPALEKACLDDEVNLGEVASCHQILTLVLGEAAPVTDSMRRAAYRIAPTVALPSEPGSRPHGSDTYTAAAPSTSTMIVGPAAYPPELTPPSTSEIAAPTGSPIESPTRAKTITRIDSPSTKETWRAEASAMEAELAFDAPSEVLMPTVIAGAATADEAGTLTESQVDPMPATAPVAARQERIAEPYAEPYPDYMPRRSSWLRSAFITGMIALLILAGLLFATGTIRDNFVTRWLGTAPQVAKTPTANMRSSSEPSSETPLPPVPEPPSRIEDEVSIVTPNLQKPAPVSSPNSTLPTPALDEEPDAVLDVSDDLSVTFGDANTLVAPQEPTHFDPPGESLPDLVEDDNFQEPRLNAGDRESEAQLAEPTPIEPSVAITRTADADPVPASDAVTRTAELQDETTPPQSLENSFVDRASDVDAAPNVVLDPADVNVTLGEASVWDRTGEPAESGTDALADNSTTESPVGLTNDKATEITTLEPSQIEPPVASSPDVGDLAVVTRQPLEPSVPSIVEPDTMEPEVGNRAKLTSLRRDDQWLLLFDEDSQAWQRVNSNVQLKVGDHLLGMPAFRSDIQIGDNLMCSVHGVARLRLGPGDDITILDGKLVLSNQDAAETQGIRFHGRRFEINMVDPESNVAIEAYHEYVPGSDITAKRPHSILKIHPLDNSISVALMEESFDLAKGRHLLAIDDFQPWTSKTSRTPKWMREESVKRIDAMARDTWKKQIQDTTEMRPWLLKQAESKRSHLFSLAARCLAEMDDFSAVVAALSDPAQSGGQYWMDHFHTLRQALSRGPEIQDLVRIQMEQAYGKAQADVMMEMLRGYSDRQLGAGSAAMLVENLTSPQLEMRVLAIENLYFITGARDYRAGDSLSSRLNDARGWQKRFRTGRLRYRTKPEVVRLLEFANEPQDR